MQAKPFRLVGAMIATCVSLTLALASFAETVVIEASRDATLIEDPAGALANGSGPAFFVGRNNAATNSIRRSLLAFDVNAAVPPGAWITGALLELETTPSNEAPIEIGLHRVLTAWNEGPSSASGGGGAFSEPGDTTWIHTFYDVELWDTAGADFTPAASAVTEVGSAGGYVWETAGMVADVQRWLDDPEANHGWILIGGEHTRQTAKSFASRESDEVAARPRLVVDYETRCAAFDLGPGALGLCRAYCEALDCAGPTPRGSARACDRLARSFARRTDAPLPCERLELQ